MKAGLEIQIGSDLTMTTHLLDSFVVQGSRGIMID